MLRHAHFYIKGEKQSSVAAMKNSYSPVPSIDVWPRIS
jgi:hypothetical protein